MSQKAVKIFNKEYLAIEFRFLLIIVYILFISND